MSGPQRTTGTPSVPRGQSTAPAFQSAGQLGRERPLALEVTRILDEVPPHLVPDQLVAEARRAAGVAVALYVVDIDGSHLLRLAGSPEFPEHIDDPPALGPEIVPEGNTRFYEPLAQRLPGCVAEPLWLRGRVTGLLLCLGNPSRRCPTSPNRAPPRWSSPMTTPTSSKRPAGTSAPPPPRKFSRTCFPPHR